MEVEQLRQHERIIKKFGISSHYTQLMIGIGLLLFPITGIIYYILTNQFARTLDVLADPIIIVISLVPLALSLYLIGLGLVIKWSYRFYLTNLRVIEVRGLVSRTTISADYHSLTDIRIVQDPLERFILKTGTIYINTAGGPHIELVLSHIDDPYEIKNMLRELAEYARKRESGVFDDTNKNSVDDSWE